MCLGIATKVIMANTLENRETKGVTLDEMYEYCDNLEEKILSLDDYGEKGVYFKFNLDEIDRVINEYNGTFYRIGKTIYCNKKINLDYFNQDTSKRIAKILMDEAKNQFEKVGANESAK